MHKYSMKTLVRYWRRAKLRLKNLVKWARFGWTVYDWDYHYAVDAFILQLEAMADFMESPRAMSVDSAERAKQIREAIAELHRVYNDDYAMAYIDRLNEKWGHWSFEFVPTGETYFNPLTGKTEPTSTMERRFEREMSPEDLEAYDRDSEAWRREAETEQELKEGEVWDKVRGQIRDWWD